MLYAASPPPPQSDPFFAAAEAAGATQRGTRWRPRPPAPAPPLYLGVDCEQWGKECGGRENMDGLRHGGPSPLLSFFQCRCRSPILRGQSSSSCKGVYKSCPNYKLPPTEERLVAAAGSVKSSVSNKQSEIGISPPPSTSCR